MGTYNELTVYKEIYDLLFEMLKFTNVFNKDYKYTVGESLKRNGKA